MMQPAGKRSKRNRAPVEEPRSVDPIALTLALWLALLVGIAGLDRLAREANADATLAQAVAEGGATPPRAPGAAMSPTTARLLIMSGG